jgi:hypothetical protein
MVTPILGQSLHFIGVLRFGPRLDHFSIRYAILKSKRRQFAPHRGLLFPEQASQPIKQAYL